MPVDIDPLSNELSQDYKLDNYIIQSVLGRGSFGVTYLAIDENLERKVAIKEYLPSGFAKRDKYQTVSPLTKDNEGLFQYGLDSFLDEAKTVVKFNHPNIVRVLAFFKRNQTAYMVMEYEVGQDLKEYLTKHQNLSERRLLEIFCPINDGLIKVHQNGYVHRDIKPANIYIRDDGSPVLIDFGAARDIFNSKIDQLTRILTQGYAPYEQDNPSWANQGPWTDIYAMGATLYYAITEQRVVSAQERASATMLKTPDPYLTICNSEQGKYSHHFLRAVDHSLAFHPDDRPQDVSDWNEALLGKDRDDDDKTAILFTGLAKPDDETIIHQPLLEKTTSKQHKEKQNDVKSPHQSKLKKKKKSKVKELESKKRSPIVPIGALLIVISVAVFFANDLFYGEEKKDEEDNVAQFEKLPPTSNLNKTSSVGHNEKTLRKNPPTSAIAATKSLEQEKPKGGGVASSTTNSQDSQSEELIRLKSEAAYTNIILAYDFFMRANIKKKAFEDYQKESLEDSSEMVTTLKLKHNELMSKFTLSSKKFLKQLKTLKKNDEKSIKKSIRELMDDDEHASKPIHIMLGEFFLYSISSSIEENDIEQKFKEKLLEASK